MATKVSATYCEPVESAEVYPGNKGTISAYVIVRAAGFHSKYTVSKKVRIDIEGEVDLDTAKNMMKNLREANNHMPESHILGLFVLEM